MSKSSIADILEVQRLIGRLDRRGKRAILKDLMKLGLDEANWGEERIKQTNIVRGPRRTVS